jgi:hypothetical protein
MPAKGKRTFWVTAAPTPLHKERVALLNQNGFDVILMPGIKELLQYNASQRASCIFIDTPSQGSTERLQMINQLAMMPEMNGVRFILIATQHSPESYRVAVAENFRDIIPLRLENDVWLHRIQFATGAKPSEFPAPLCEISMNQVAIAIAPARIIWINETHIRIECRGNQRIGSALQMTGPIAASFGVPHISLTVESIHKDQLHYRFSQALVCRWRVSPSHSEQASALIRRLPTSHQDAKLRAFVAISESDRRKSVITNLSAAKYDIKVGLQRKNLSQELRYFSPDVIFFDEKLLQALTEVELRTMFAHLSSDVPAVIFGDQFDRQRFSSALGDRRFFVESDRHHEALQNAAERYRLKASMMTAQSGEPTRLLPVDHPWSKIDVLLPARLVSLNPLVGEISLPYSMGSFSLVKLEAPILRQALGRDPYIKITNTSEIRSSLQASQFTHHAHFYLADVDRDEQLKLVNNLVLMISDYYQKQFAAAPLNHALSEPEVSGPTISEHDIAKSAGINFKDTPTVEPVFTDDASYTKTRRREIKSQRDIDIFGTLRRRIDPTIVKAICVFIIAIGIMALVLNVAMNVDESFYKDHGREYSNFFQRMTNPEFRKANPAPGLKRLNRNNDSDPESPP